MVDTDICGYAMRGHPVVLEHFASHRRSEIVLSVIAEAELRFGVAKARRRGDEDAVERFLSKFEILDLTSHEAEEYGELRAELQRAGTPIGDMDLLLAAHARAQKLIFVTNHEREFRRVPGLKVENWTRS